MEISNVYRLGSEGAAELVEAAPERVRAGTGLAKVWNGFTGADGRFSAGIWQAQPGVRTVHYTETELCVLIEGRVRLTSAEGKSVEFEAGDAFVIAPGFSGEWESIGRVTKVYAVLEPGDPA